MNKVLISCALIAIVLSSCAIKKKALNLDSNTIDIAKVETLNIWTNQTKVQEAINFEQSLQEEKKVLQQVVYLSESVFPSFKNFDIAQPYIVNRNLNDHIPIYAEYYYSREDSILRYVSYDWEKGRFENSFEIEKMWEEESTKIELYNNKYEEIKSILIRDFGIPLSQDSMPMMTKSQWGQSDYLSRNTIWETEYLHAKLNMIFATNTFRIRLNYYWLE